MQKSFIRWIVNVLAFVVFTFQALTGLGAWMLPHGGGAAQSLRHVLHSLHMAAGVALVVVIGVHLSLHWTYIIENLRKYGMLKR